MCWTDPQLSPPLLLQVPPGRGEGSDGTMPWEPRETRRTVGFVMTSERSGPRGPEVRVPYLITGTTNPEWMLALSLEFGLRELGDRSATPPGPTGAL